jgi:MscS family membrane protein
MRSAVALLLLALWWVIAVATVARAQTPVPAATAVAADPAPAATPAVAQPSALPAAGASTEEAVRAAAVATPAALGRAATFERDIPAPLREPSFLGLRVWQWIALPILLVIAFVIAAIATILVRRVLLPAAERTPSPVDDRLVRSARGPLLFAFTVMFFAAGLPMLALGDPVHVFLRGLLKGLGVTGLAWAALRLLDVFAVRLGNRFEREGRRRLAALVPLGRRTAKFFLAVVTVVVLLQNVGLDVTGLIAGLGVGGIALALAAQKTIENVFGGISVIADQPVRVGDLCRFRDGRQGVVEEIGMRSTRIRTADRSLVTIPNADFAQRELENLAVRDRIRFLIVMGVRWESTPEQLRRVLAEARTLLAAHPKVSADTVRIFLIGFGVNSFDIEASALVRTTNADEFNAVREDLLLGLMETVERCGTGLARPVTLVPAGGSAPSASRPAPPG